MLYSPNKLISIIFVLKAYLSHILRHFSITYNYVAAIKPKLKISSNYFDQIWMKYFKNKISRIQIKHSLTYHKNYKIQDFISKMGKNMTSMLKV